MARTWMDMHRLRRLHDSQYIMKNPFTNENSNLSNIFHNNIHRKKVESLKVRSTEEFLCQFAWLPCRFFRGRRQGRQPLNKEFRMRIPNRHSICFQSGFAWHWNILFDNRKLWWENWGVYLDMHPCCIWDELSGLPRGPIQLYMTSTHVETPYLCTCCLGGYIYIYV